MTIINIENNINMNHENHENFINVNSKELKKINYLNKNCLNIKRNYGLDFLRIFAMINIIILHINLANRELKYNYKAPKFKSIWLLEAMAYWAVDGFGIISGIVGYKKYKFSNLIYLWTQTLFYSSIKSINLFFRKKESLKSLILSFFPLLTQFHWYVNAYFYMYLLLPFINLGINNLNSKTYESLIIFFILFYSIYHIISSIILIKNDFHFLLNGYSSMWLTILYIIGGYLGKNVFSKSLGQSIYYFIFLILIYVISFCFTFEIFVLLLKKKSKISSNLFINYLSPTIVLEALSLVFIFSRLKITINIIKKTIVFLTPLTFNTTLIHSILFGDNYLRNSLLKWIKTFSPNYVFYKIYGMAILIFIGCSLIDYLRFLIFKILKIRDLCVFFENQYPKLIDKLKNVY